MKCLVDGRSSIEVSLWVTGLSLLAAYAAARAWSAHASNQGIVAMREARAVEAAASRLARTYVEVGVAAAPLHAPAPDTATWSKARRDAYRATTVGFSMPLAVLRIPSLGLAVPIYDGTSNRVLNRGAGLIAGTAWPGEGGNMGVAAHRDGFFRVLEGITVGAELHIDVVQRTRRYRVTDISVVAPQDVAVLAHTMRPTVTLVTCYPFYFLGAAPQRFIVRAEVTD